MRNLVLLAFTLCTLMAQANNGRALERLLRQCIQREDVTPDSIFTDIPMLEQYRLQQTSPSDRAVCAAVMGHIYVRNANRAQAYTFATPANPDSIQEWSRMDWYRAAAMRFEEAFADLDALASASTRAWTPLVERGASEHVFRGDMLYVAWAALLSAPREVRQMPGTHFPDYGRLITYYNSRGNRDAALQLELDSLDMRGEELQIATLQRLLNQYSGSPLCAEVYDRLANMPDQTEAQQLAWLEEGLRLYPKSPYAVNLRNSLLVLRTPILRCSAPSIVHSDSAWVYRMHAVKNVCSMRVDVYSLPRDFDSGRHVTIDTIARYGQLQNTLQHDFLYHEPHITFSDSIPMPPMPYGYYAFVVTPSTDADISRSMSRDYLLMQVSDMKVLYNRLNQSTGRYIVVDAQSGAPIRGVQMEVGSKQQWRTVAFSDSRGIIDLPYDSLPQSRHRWRVSHGEDRFLSSYSQYSDWGDFYSESRDTVTHIELYTDRNIYRPGQTVHISGIVYRQHQWEMHVVKDYDVELVVEDANRKTVSEAALKADAMGVFSYDVELPKDRLPGYYSVRVGETSHVFRVEEYRRPTFLVEMDEAPSLRLPVDSITLTGQALNYSGTPVRGARVTGTYSWRNHSWCRMYFPDTTPLQTDTVYTDQEGRFSITVPVSLSDEESRWGRMLSLNVDVLNPAGETQQGEAFVSLSSQALQAYMSVPSMIDKEAPGRLNVEVLSSTYKHVDATVQCQLYRDGEQVFACEFPSGKPQSTELFADLPSGRYDLRATAVVLGDTATEHCSVVLFSQRDTHVPVDTLLWYYAPRTQYSRQEGTARVQVGSSLSDVYLYYTLQYGERIAQDTLIHFSDSLLTFDIPYTTQDERVALARFVFVRNGQMYTHTETLHQERPDNKLTYHWDTFRDRLLPGQRERWTMTLRHLDGTPARANVMATMYDASLDALAAGNYWGLYTSLRYGTHSQWWRTDVKWTSSSTASSSGAFHHPDLYESEYSHLDDTYFPAFMHYLDYGPRRKVRDVMYEGGSSREVMRLGAIPEASEDEDELQGSIGGLTLATNFAAETQTREAEPQEAAPEKPAFLRENFQETAFFYPALRTNASGQVSISFTLPQSLTTWRMLSVAHTADMHTVSLQAEAVAQKPFMATLSLPRFLRQGDQASLSATIENVSEEPRKGKGTLLLIDPMTDRVLNRQTCTFDLQPGTSQSYAFPYTVPQGVDMLVCRWQAEGQGDSDGEQRYLAVLSNQELVTVTRAFSWRGQGKHELPLAHLVPDGTVTDPQLTVEYTPDPIWLALETLPALQTPQYEDALSLATACYAGKIAQFIADNNPQVGEVLSQLKDEEKVSPLAQNEELKGLLLRETPWVAQAEWEAGRMERLHTLFDAAQQSALQSASMEKLRALQTDEGGFRWLPDMPVSEYITREVAYLLTREQLLTGRTDTPMLQAAVRYLQSENHKWIEHMRQHKDKPTSLSLSSLRLLYVQYASGLPLTGQAREDADFLLDALTKRATEDMSREECALAALVLHYAGREKLALHYLAKVEHYLVHDEEQGTHINYPSGSFTSIDRKLHIHTQILEAEQVLHPQATEVISGMRQHLLAQKRTQQWSTSVNSANAVYALLMRTDADYRLSVNVEDKVSVVYGEHSRQPLVGDRSTIGQLHETVSATKRPQTLEVEKQHDNDSWGAVYLQYRQPLDEVERAEQGLRIRAEYSTNAVAVGDHVHVQYVITADRDYEYVCLHAPRPATLEPVRTLSGYRYTDGIGYYRAFHDASIDYFVQRLPRGTYVLEEDMTATSPGVYSNGSVTLRCLYAPEYQAHTSDMKLEVRTR